MRTRWQEGTLIRLVAASAALAFVALGVVLTLLARRRSDVVDLYSEVQWDPYPYSYASGS